MLFDCRLQTLLLTKLMAWSHSSPQSLQIATNEKLDYYAVRQTI